MHSGASSNTDSLPPPMSSVHRVRPAIIAVIAWIALWGAYFAPILPRSKVLAPLDILESLERPWARTDRIDVWNAFCYDAISQYIPYDYAVFKSLRDDGRIGWNPDTHNGTSIRENHMLCPSSLRHLFYVFFPFWDAWDWGRMVHFLLAGIGMILLLSESGLSACAALLGAIAFSFSSQMVVWIHSDVMASGCCWSPWMLWSLFRLRRLAKTFSAERTCGRRYRLAIAILLAGSFTGAALRCGFLHTAFFNATLLVLFLALETFPRKSRHRTFRWPIHLALAIGLAIAAPWFAEVLPPAILGGHALRPRPLGTGLAAIPTLATALFPGLLGSPQGLDAFKLFGSDFTEIKFVGGIVFVLALLALFHRDAPRFPKLLFLLFLAIPFSPLAKWYYHRCFVLSALGAGWLSAWRIDWQVRNAPSRAWRRILEVFALFCLLWAAASIAVLLLEDFFLPKILSFASGHLPTNKSARADWMARRAVRFYEDCKIWTPRNLAELAVLGFGLAAASRICTGRRCNVLARNVVVLSAFAELFLFGACIVRPCDRPEPADDSPYPDREWVRRFKSHLGNGSVLFWQDPEHPDFDYMQLNAPSAHGIRQAEGYESVRPVRLGPLERNKFLPADFAAAGISHVSTPHETTFPNAGNWRLVEASREFDLYENPAFLGIFVATLADGSTKPLFAESKTPNSVRLLLPAGTASLRIAATQHPGWFYRLDTGPFVPLPPSADGYRACAIRLPVPAASDTRLELRFFR